MHEELSAELSEVIILAMVRKMVDLAVEYGDDLTELQRFMENIVRELELPYEVPNLWKLRYERGE